MKSQTPKALHRICGKELVRLAVETAKAGGLAPVAVVVPSDSEAIQKALGSDVLYAVQDRPLGTGHALMQARSLLDGNAESVVVINGDVPLLRPETLFQMARVHDEREAVVTLLTATLANPDGLGRIVRSASGRIAAIVEESEADENTRAIREINVGLYCFRASWLWDNIGRLRPSPRKGELFLTDLIEAAVKQGAIVESVEVSDAREAMSVNNRVQLAEAESVLRGRIREHWMLNGVTMPDPGSVYIDATVELGEDTVVLPNTHITSGSRIGRNCSIGPNSIVSESEIADGCKVVASVVEGSRLEEGVDVGPFSHLRPGSHLKKRVHIGNFVEVKNSRIGEGTASGHFSYIGDAELGSNVNVGAGSITCNYDGVHKHRTEIGDDVFIGCDTMLIAPVKVGDRAATGAGAVVTKDVPPDTVVVGVPAKELKKKDGKSQQ